MGFSPMRRLKVSASIAVGRRRVSRFIADDQIISAYLLSFQLESKSRLRGI